MAIGLEDAVANKYLDWLTNVIVHDRGTWSCTEEEVWLSIAQRRIHVGQNYQNATKTVSLSIICARLWRLFFSLNLTFYRLVIKLFPTLATVPPMKFDANSMFDIFIYFKNRDVVSTSSVSKLFDSSSLYKNKTKLLKY